MRISFRCLQAADRAIPRLNNVGFVGLGQMGYAMATNWLTKRIEDPGMASTDGGFVVCDVDHARAKTFADTFNAQYPRANVTIATSPAEVVMNARVLLTMLPSSPQVKEAYQGPSGILSALRTLPKDGVTSTLCIDSTTLDVDVARQVAKEIKEAGAEMVDAPVSGGVAGARAGTLSFLVGGTKDEFTHASPVLSLMGSRIMHCGASGAGLVAKICNNLVLGVQQIVVGEGMLLGQKLGLDPAVLAGVINNSTGGCWACSVNNPVSGALPDKSPPCDRNYEGGFQTVLMLKDMGLATHIGSSTGSPLPLAGAAERIYAKVVEECPELARKDFSSVYKYLERAAEGGKKISIA